MTVHPRRLAVAAGVPFAAALLAGCEYADAEPRPAGSSAALQSAPVSSTMSADEAASQAGLMTEVETLMGPPDGVVFLGAAGGMGGGQGIEASGLLPEAGTYALRAVCTDGPGAIVTVRQHGALLVSQSIDCGTPYDAVLELASGRVSAALEPTGQVGRLGGAVRFADSQPGDTGAGG